MHDKSFINEILNFNSVYASTVGPQPRGGQRAEPPLKYFEPFGVISRFCKFGLFLIDILLPYICYVFALFCNFI